MPSPFAREILNGLLETSVGSFAEGQAHAARAFYYVCNFKDKPWSCGIPQPDLSPREFEFSVGTIIKHLKDCIKSYQKALEKVECVRESVRQHIQEADAEYEEEARRIVDAIRSREALFKRGRSDGRFATSDAGGVVAPVAEGDVERIPATCDEITVGPLPENSPS